MFMAFLNNSRNWKQPGVINRSMDKQMWCFYLRNETPFSSEGGQTTDTYHTQMSPKTLC